MENGLWPLVETLLGWHEVAGLAVAVVRGEEVVARVRRPGRAHRRTGHTETMFHLASVSKPFVATAVVSLATARSAGEPGARPGCADHRVGARVHAGRRSGRRGHGAAAAEPARAASPTSPDYGWHEPQLGNDALSEFARSLSGWRLTSEPGSTFSYSNAGFELLGLLLSRVTGTTFEDAVHQRLLTPLGMRTSTFLRADVPRKLAASPHVGMPLSVPDDAYPYTRRHAPSSTLHSNLVEMCWMVAHFEHAEDDAGDSSGQWKRLDPGLRDLMWQPVMPIGDPPWDKAAALGWSVGQLPRAPHAEPQRAGPRVRVEARAGA